MGLVCSRWCQMNYFVFCLGTCEYYHPTLLDRLWAPSSACDLTSGNSTLLLEKRASLSDCIPVHFLLASIVFYAPGFSASRGRYLGRAWPPHQVVLLLVVLLGRGDAHHPCSFLPRTAALDNVHLSLQHPRISNNQPKYPPEQT